MLTLSDASTDTKKFLLWLGIGIGALLCLFLLFKAILFIKEVIYPTPPPKPTVAFGKLQPAFFPGNITDQQFKYSVNTISGDLPEFVDQMKVYVINPNEPDLLALNKMQDRFYNAGFAGTPIELNNKTFRWSFDTNRGGIPKIITGDIVNSSFIIDSDFLTNPEVLSGADLPDEKGAIDVSSRLLQDMDFFSEDIDPVKIKTKLFSIQNNKLASSTSLSNSQIIEVDYFQKDIDKMPIMYEDATSSNIKFLVAGGNVAGEVVSGRYINQQVSDKSSTYPIITAEQAFDKLNKGLGYISSYFGTSSNISIHNVFLAYYISSQAQDFTIPIFVFEGNDGFNAYVNAVPDEWINK